MLDFIVRRSVATGWCLAINSNEISSTSFLFPNQCGVWRTGYAPIITTNGKIDAIHCVDGSVIESNNLFKNSLQLSYFIVIFSFIFCFILSFFVNIKIFQSTQQKSNLGGTDGN